MRRSSCVQRDVVSRCTLLAIAGIGLGLAHGAGSQTGGYQTSDRANSRNQSVLLRHAFAKCPGAITDLWPLCECNRLCQRGSPQPFAWDRIAGHAGIP